MDTKEKVKKDFLNDLSDLMNKYSVPGWPADVEVFDSSMVVSIPGIWDDNGECIRQSCDFDIGVYFDKEIKNEKS